MSITKTNRSKLFGKIKYAYLENNSQQVNTLRDRMQTFVVLYYMVHVVTIMLERGNEECLSDDFYKN